MAKKFSAATSKVTANFTDPTIVYLMGVENSGTPASFKATAFDVVRTGLTVTWSGTGTGATPLLVNVNETGGPANAASKLLDLQVGGTSSFAVNRAGDLTLGSSGVGRTITVNTILYNGALQLKHAATSDDVRISTIASGTPVLGFYNVATQLTQLHAEASDILAQRRGTNAQRYRVYNTDNGANDELLEIGFATGGNIARFYSMQTGTGTARSISIGIGTTEYLGIAASDGEVSMSGPVKFGTHSTIGAETVSGYITIKDAAGNTRKLAVVS